MSTQTTICNVSDFVQDTQNSNKSSDSGHLALRKSLEAVGAGRGIVVDKHGNIIGGNQIQKAALANGITKAVVVDTDGDTLVVTRRTDLDLNDTEDYRARAAAIADNTVSKASQNLDMALISEQVAMFDMPIDVLGLDADDLVGFSSVDSVDDVDLTVAEEAPERQEELDEDFEDESNVIPTSKPKESPKQIIQLIIDCKTKKEQREKMQELLDLGYNVRANFIES